MKKLLTIALLVVLSSCSDEKEITPGSIRINVLVNNNSDTIYQTERYNWFFGHSQYEWEKDKSFKDKAEALTYMKIQNEKAENEDYKSVQFIND